MISLIFCGDLKYCPYLRRYTERLEKYHVEYEVLYWDRDNTKDVYPTNYLGYRVASPENLSKKEKLKDFYGFRKWLIERIKLNKSEGLVLLSTLSGMVLYGHLHKKKYIFDIRDYSFEHINIFRLIEKRIIKNSFFTAISSKAFKHFLPEHEYVIAHNFNRKEIMSGFKFEKKEAPLEFVWNGTIRYLGFQKQYIDALKNDDRFLLVYHGAGTELESFKNYCIENSIKNVKFTGKYNNDDKSKLLSSAAILNNCYGGESGDVLKYAISNRFYDGLIFRIPQVVEPGGYKEEETLKQNVGIASLARDNFANDLYEYYMNIDTESFNSNCKRMLDIIINEDNLYISKIDKFITLF